MLEEQQKRETERLARKPIAEITLRTSAGPKLLDDLEKGPPLDFALEKNKNWDRLIFVVTNKGNAEISRPIVRIVASPDTVFVDPPEFRLAERVDHHVFQVSGHNINDMDPIEVAGGGYSFAVAVTVPDSINAFELTFSLQARNLSRKTHTLHLKVVRPSS